MFGGAKAKAGSVAAPPVPGGGGLSQSLEDDLGEEQPEVVLAESTRPDGAAARIVYRSAGAVEAKALESLCTKVGWPARPIAKVQAALANSYIVASLHLVLAPAAGGGLPRRVAPPCVCARWAPSVAAPPVCPAIIKCSQSHARPP